MIQDMRMRSCEIVRYEKCKGILTRRALEVGGLCYNKYFIYIYIYPSHIIPVVEVSDQYSRVCAAEAARIRGGGRCHCWSGPFNNYNRRQIEASKKRKASNDGRTRSRALLIKETHNFHVVGIKNRLAIIHQMTHR